MKYSLQGNKLHPIKGIFHIVLSLVPQGNLKGQKERQLTNLGRQGKGWESTSLPILPRHIENFQCRTNSLSATNFIYWLMRVEFIPINAQGSASHTNSVSISTASSTRLWTRSDSSGLCNKLQAIEMHWLIIHSPESYQSFETNMRMYSSTTSIHHFIQNNNEWKNQ